MLHIRVGKRVAGGLFRMDMRTVHGDTRETDALLKTEVVGSLVFGIQVVDRCSTGSTNWHQMRLGSKHRYRSISIQPRSHWLGYKSSTQNTYLNFISKARLPLLIQYPVIELDEHHRPKPTNHAHLESASEVLNPTILHTPTFQSRTFCIVPQPSA